jgi:thioredoxin 1
MIAVIPLTAALAGCAPSTTPFGGMPHVVAAELPARDDSVARKASTRAETAPPTRGEATQDQAGQRPVALTAARTTDPTLTLFTEPKKEKAMTSTHEKSLFRGNVQHVGSDRFQQDVLDANVPVLVDFYADWCGPCRMLAPVLDQVARETPHAKVVKVNIDDSPQIAQAYGVSSIPTVMVFKDGSVVAQHTGLADRGTLQQLLAR